MNLYPNYVGDNLPTFVLASRVTLVGDAAHAHGGAFAAGGSLALDDSLALGLAFKYVFSQSGTGNLSLDSRIQHVMKLYDETRRPHTARLPEIVHSQVKFKPSDNDMTPEEEDQALVQKAKGRLNMDWLSEHDVNAAFGDVIRVREEQKSSKL